MYDLHYLYLFDYNNPHRLPFSTPLPQFPSRPESLHLLKSPLWNDRISIYYFPEHRFRVSILVFINKQLYLSPSSLSLHNRDFTWYDTPSRGQGFFKCSWDILEKYKPVHPAAKTANLLVIALPNILYVHSWIVKHMIAAFVWENRQWRRRVW